MLSGGRRRWPIQSGIVLAAILCPLAMFAQSYGDQDQTLTLGAAAFRAASLQGGYSESDGYMSNPQLASQSFRAALPLPEGAELRQICMYAYDPSSGYDAAVSVVAVKLVPGGGGPATVTIPNTSVSSTGFIGYGYYCTATFSFTIHDVFDLDGDGTPDAVVYYLQADLPSEAQQVELGGVRLTWRRQVRPPPATPTFGDVPPTDGAFRFIEAMAASGITGGCGGGNYCPDAHVTRRQMAVFLAKALGLHWGN